MLLVIQNTVLKLAYAVGQNQTLAYEGLHCAQQLVGQVAPGKHVVTVKYYYK